MPSRIMSIAKNSSATKEKPLHPTKKESEKKKKEPKDRSALVGIKRNRKSKDQIYTLQKFFDNAGDKPTKS